MLNCTKNWQPIWHNKINYSISGGLLYVSSGLAFPAAPAQNISLQKPTAGFFPNSFHKKEPSVLWLLMQKQWSSGRTPETKTVSTTRKNSYHAPRKKGRVARAPTSATVKTNSLQSLQGPKHKEKKKSKYFHTNSAEFHSWANMPAQGLTRAHGVSHQKKTPHKIRCKAKKKA